MQRSCARIAPIFAVLLAACGDESPAQHHTTGTGGASSTLSSTSTSMGPGGGGHGGAGGGQGGTGGFAGTAVANAGPDQTVFRGDFVQLMGSGKVASGTPTFIWTQVSGEPVTLDDPTLLTPYFFAPAAPGPLVFSLVAFDGPAPSMPDEVTIDVVNRPPVAKAGPDLGALGGSTVTLQGQGVDGDGDPLQYTWTQVSGPPVALSDPTLATPALVVPEGLTEPLVFALTVSDGFATSEIDWVTVRRLTGLDSDGDLLEDDIELGLGTDPHAPDTDHDGIPDGWEVLGHEGVDYPGLGCDPLHRDLLVELDVQEYEKDSALHSARPSAALESALIDFYAGLPLDNPDGVPGVALHLVVDSLLDESFQCKVSGDDAFDDVGSPPNFLFREAFHRVEVCLGGGAAGLAQIGGARFNMIVQELNADPSDDATEAAAFGYFAVFLHEMGHNLGLRHGGSTDFNNKPTYPSLMNYAYNLGFGPQTLAGSIQRFSKGILPTIDECALVEQGVFAGIPPASLEFLASYPGAGGGWTVEPDGSVDWNHDGVITSAPYSLMLHFPGEGDPMVCTFLGDHDDFATLSFGLAAALPSNPSAALPLQIGGPRLPTAP